MTSRPRQELGAILDGLPADCSLSPRATAALELLEVSLTGCPDLLDQLTLAVVRAWLALGLVDRLLADRTEAVDEVLAALDALTNIGGAYLATRRPRGTS